VTEPTMADDDLRCIELVEEISAYIDGQVDDAERARIDHHLEGCLGCQAAVDQFRTVKRVTGRLSPVDVASTDPLIRDRLMSTLRITRRR
jgi:anti-sigma factor RsiW